MKYRIKLLEQLRDDLRELKFYINDSEIQKKDSEYKWRNDKCKYLYEKVLTDIDQIDKYLKNKEWEFKKIRLHELFNSLLLVIPTILGISILIYNINSIEQSKKFDDKLKKMESINNNLKLENKRLKNTTKTFQDSLKKLKVKP